MSLLKKVRGDGDPLPPQPTARSAAFAWLGGFLAIAAVAVLTDYLEIALVLGSFGASCVLVFGFPDLPFAQPRNVILGHFLSLLIGLAFLTEPSWSFLLYPTLAGALTVVAVALIYNNATRETAYPKYW